MVKATAIDMSLSDIISTNRKNKKVVKKPIKKSAGGIRKRGNASNVGTPRRQSGGTSRGGGRMGNTVRRSAGGSSNDNKQVRINISNLAETVISSDLQELFGAFNLHKVSVNFNENGGAAGTGDITLKKYDADRLIQKFAGVALDGKVMHFAVIESSNFARKPEIRGTPNRRQSSGKPINRKVANPPRRQNAAKPPVKKGKKPAREQKPPKTAEQLDAELDAYMSRSA
ncbi:Chromatin target of PRMT1 protein C-terminal domain-containing protein [Caenorhabditis elegans]|uniref:Chromatin target of PRMT1 protein C-terminal domain-containing protein n=1 Tax=Caenorhabditis elegans TaxID=6239 RepID=O62183_CAEEL|nr:Chromatin target of PRMT1 protein C-terminal domain-containing protein [Caenorhabditis elegans]CAB05180.1 Chromatin target of PRMT1 protein C-terminal domain-containing protein [Caenorhabditis elegans]|eukprot:NP_501594.1 Ref/ALY RNA export adaptor family [Caenorhabditis elegans]